MTRASELLLVQGQLVADFLHARFESHDVLSESLLRWRLDSTFQNDDAVRVQLVGDATQGRSLAERIETGLQRRADIGFRLLRLIERHFVLRPNRSALISILLNLVRVVVLTAPLAVVLLLLPIVLLLLAGALIAADESLLLIAATDELIQIPLVQQ